MSLEFNAALFHEQVNVFNSITLGIVEDVDDPIQQLRVRVRCPVLGDVESKKTADIPWAFVASPLLGSTVPGDMYSSGSKAHGLVLPAQVGSMAIVCVIDKNPNMRVCLGFISNTYDINTFPNGRFPVANEQQYGPVDTANRYIEDYRSVAFGRPSSSNYEWVTRVADPQCAAINENNKNLTNEKTLDPFLSSVTMDDGQQYSITQGYKDNNTSSNSINTHKSPVYGLVTPAGHSVFMCDSSDSSKIKLKTVKGSQLILDDTNERIYINTAEGNNWIEMDFDGNVDMFCYNFNVHARNNINLTADKLVNITGNGIHNQAHTEIRLTSTNDTHISAANLRIKTSEDMFFENKNLNIKSSENIVINSDKKISIKTKGDSGDDIVIDSKKNVMCKATINIINDAIVGSVVKGNFGVQGTAGFIGGNYFMPSPVPNTTTMPNPLPSSDTATSSNSQIAFWSNRVPDHEPWARRSFVDGNTDHETFKIMSYDDPNIGREDVINLTNGERNMFWRR